MKNQHIITVLENCLRVIEKIPAGEFDLTHWRCGTTACVIGHCASDSWFNEQGLTLVRETPHHASLTGWDAVNSLLGGSVFLGGLPFGHGCFGFMEFLFARSSYKQARRINVQARLKRVIRLLKAEKPITYEDLGTNLDDVNPHTVDYFNSHFVKSN